MLRLVQQYFSDSAARLPHKPAVCCANDSLSFREVEEFTNAFARHLQAAGVTRGQFVPFFLEKSVRSILSVLSILKADCAYVPIDFKSPGQRMQLILNAAEARVVIVDDESQVVFEQLIAAAERPLLLNISRFKPQNVAPLPAKNLSIDVAYVLFTSGSTGVPKGVMIPHKAIIDYIEWCVETYELTENDVISNHAPLYFDNSTFDLYCAFKTGATLHLVHEELNAVLPRLVSWLSERQITTFFCVPSVLTLLLRSRRLKPDSFPKLRHVIAAGEVLPRDILAEWMEMYPHIQFTNMYGPTEITVDCSYHILHEKPGKDMLSIPIGKARTNMELFVRTGGGELSQAIGAEGELLVRGTSVAYGYLGDAKRTQEAFIQNPLNRFFHDPLYCTGDLVRIDENADYLFLGRADDQIKFLGYRIELGEIEASLAGIDGVHEGVVVFNNSSVEAERELGALVSLEEGFDLDALRHALQKRLPKYMVPTRFKVTGEDFPRTPNGKYDRKRTLKIVFG
ncbi:MAG: amino acid adenylation domain-containing protein [Betaproteobacteria bacterium]|nr:MAG: amino acid adenylation domain-containing protein [Betaproteobacteria bacterium]